MLAETGEWSQAHAAARTWRQLAPGDRLGADLLCAEASLRLTDYPAALRELAPHLAAAQKDPAAFADVIRMQARILVLSGDYDRASELLQPLLKEKPWRIYYYYLASLLIKNVDVAARWFTELSQVIPADQIDERVNLAGGWIDKGIKNKREDFRNTGRDMLRNLMGSNADTVTVVYGSALFQAEDGDRKAGEAGYRKVLTMDPRHTLAMNNLAMLLAEDNRNLDEAASLIGKALEIQPNVPAFIYTLAFVEGKRKNQSAAVAAIQKAIALDPVNPLWRLRKVELRLDFSDRDGASQAIGEIDQLNKKLFSEEIMERIQALRKRVSGTPATLPTGR
jgi:tetratricopeptide (TPR) repeat protein